MNEAPTSLHLEIIDYNKNLLINEIQLEIQNSIYYIDSNILLIDINNFQVNLDDYYVENLILYCGNENRKVNYRIRIVQNQVNYSYIKLNEINNNSFEIMLFDKNIKDLPSKLNVKINDKEYYLSESCKSDIPYIKNFLLLIVALILLLIIIIKKFI